MIAKILKDVINGRDIQSMKCSEARRIVDEFYLRVLCLTLGTRNPQRVEFLTNQALEKAGLEFFA